MLMDLYRYFFIHLFEGDVKERKQYLKFAAKRGRHKTYPYITISSVSVGYLEKRGVLYFKLLKTSFESREV
jgi:hypothetical protein